MELNSSGQAKPSVSRALARDLRRPWSIWAKVSVACSAAWLGLWARQGLAHSVPDAAGIAQFPLLWVAIVAGLIAMTQEGSSKIAVLSGMVVITALGWPVLLLTFVWLPVLFLEALSLRQPVFAVFGSTRAMSLVWIVGFVLVVIAGIIYRHIRARITSHQD
ncbi:MAG TPA: hypothetical protein VG204_14605 [Terriglobia bacterium]|nr:hypothetical protein [Terriglobia bacterium]